MRYPLAGLCFLMLPTWVNAASPDAAPDWVYTVRPGDTLIEIAQTYLNQPNNWRPLQRDNHIANPMAIPPGTQLRIPANLLKHSPSSAKLIALTGAVLFRQGAEGAWQAATVGQKLAVGDAVQTPPEGYAVLELANGSRINIQASALVVLDTLSLYAEGLMADTRLRLNIGRVEIVDNPQRQTNQHLRVITPTAQAVVRGTEFRVGVEGQTTREETLDGAIAFRAATKTVAVEQGFGSLSVNGQAPHPPVALLAAPDVSGLPKRVEQLPIRFPLPVMANAASMVGEVVAASQAEPVLLAKSSTSKTLNFADLPNGDYILRLSATDRLGLQGYTALHPFTVFARPFFPPVNQPQVDGVVRSPRPEFSWGQILDVTASHIQIATSADFKHPLFDAQIGANRWSPPADLPAGALFWRVASIDKIQGPWTPAIAFTYKPAPALVDITQAAMQITGDGLHYDLPKPEAGLHYLVSLSAVRSMDPLVMPAVESHSGKVVMPRFGVGDFYLSVRLVDDSDGTQGPAVVQKISVPITRPYLLP
ncbi:MAG: FecR domain-containing protein [Halothiobacillus sp.]